MDTVEADFATLAGSLSKLEISVGSIVSGVFFFLSYDLGELDIMRNRH